MELARLLFAFVFVMLAPGLACSQSEPTGVLSGALGGTFRNPVPYRVECRCCFVDPDGPCCSGPCNIAMSRFFPDQMIRQESIGTLDLIVNAPADTLSSGGILTPMCLDPRASACPHNIQTGFELKQLRGDAHIPSNEALRALSIDTENIKKKEF